MARTNYLKAGGTFKFVDTAEDDVYYFPANKAEMIEVTNATSVIVTFSQSGDHATQNVDLTCTSGKSDEVAAIMAEYIMTSGSAAGGSAGMTEFVAATAPIADVTGIATAKALS
jgi:hypothetical protein